MGKKFPLGAAISISAVTAAVTVSLTYVYAMNSFNSKVADINERQAMYQKLSEIDQKARQDYIGTIDDASLTDGICAGYVAGLGDSHAQYLSARKYKEYLAANSSKSIGVGIKTVQDEDGNMEVTEVLPNSPAEKAGIKKGDVIVTMDGKEIVRITYGDALNKLDGTAGTKVALGVLRPKAQPVSSSSSAAAASERMTLTVTRAEYTEQTVTHSMINGNAAYLKISEFTQDTPAKFSSSLNKLLGEGACGLVVDLRNNPGGSVEAAAKVLDVLLPAGNTVSSRDKSGKVTVEYASKSGEVDLPVSVLINGSTYGAAEIFAADIRDFKKGLLVGEKTAGYGTKDEAVPLSDGSAMILSVADYLTLGGKTFNGTGIGADMNKSLTAEQENKLIRSRLPFAEDPQIQAGVTALIRQGAAVRQVPGTSSSSGAATSQSPAD
ncbi:Carboxy-terminal processing protease CtpA [Caprobacter fermentans]|uniref:Carboxy-terminal processing protease CtpA n=1 Tax=Caproicibacter fermentans TaxID=2576756 RepID=A0A6N8HYU4_9FIRM|nr:S41 family peptidase [Caproicibacter fermentans]MVB10986.1 Carboxy-terminal processing protease CtpA [Caproicibacter fermentans]